MIIHLTARLAKHAHVTLKGMRPQSYEITAHTRHGTQCTCSSDTQRLAGADVAAADVAAAAY